MRKLIITRDIVHRMMTHITVACPAEACGLIGGVVSQMEKQQVFTASLFTAISNVSPLPTTRFDMDRGEMVRAITAFEKARCEVVAIFHSHPHTAPELSPADLREMTWFDVVHVVVGYACAEPTIQAWTVEYAHRVSVQAELVIVE
jgi:[CysO sulfur-carrier protein]-S-L-cysteine hydrolase